MSTNTASTTSAVSGNAKKGKFDNCVPKAVTTAKVMDKDKNERSWNLIYRAAGIESAAESIKLALRCAIYVYFAKNGTSPNGGYPGFVESGAGTKLLASKIVEAVGRYDIRQFARANAEEACEFFHETEVLSEDDHMIAMCLRYEIRPADAVGCVDFLDDCITLRPTEADAAKVIKNFSLRRARAANGGRDMRDMRDDHLDDALEAQGAQKVLPPQASGW